MNTQQKVLIVIPIYNEEKTIKKAVVETTVFLEKTNYNYRILVTDNNSTDNSADIIKELQTSYSKLDYKKYNQKGRGLALYDAWSTATEEVLAYMDVDLSSPLEDLPRILDPILNNQTDITFGSRLLKPGKAHNRTLKREITSRVYNRLLQITLGAKFKDAQCGFKAIRASTFNNLKSEIQNKTWFFDTEILLLAQYSNYRMQEVPIQWIDDPNSTVQIIPTVKNNLTHMGRMYKTYKPHSLINKIIWFVLIGGMSTVLTLLVYALLRLIVEPQIANIISLTIATILNTSLNKKISFRNKEKSPLKKTLTVSAISYLCYWFPTSLLLYLLSMAGITEKIIIEIITLACGTIVGMALKFVLLQKVYDTKTPTETSEIRMIQK